MNHRWWELMEAIKDTELPHGALASATVYRPQKKAINRESVALIAYVAAKAAGEAGLTRTEFIDLCNDEFSKAVPPPPPPKPSEDKDFSEADIVKALSGMMAPAVAKAVVSRLKNKEAKGADK
jgi:hypothetical protein